MLSLTIFCDNTVAASTVASGVLSCQMFGASIKNASVAANKADAFRAVPTDISPAVPAERLSEAELEGDRELEGLSDAEELELGLTLDDALELGDCDRLDEADGEREDEGLKLDEGLSETLADGDSELDGLDERLRDGEIELDGLRDKEALTDAELEGDNELEGESESEVLELGDNELEGEVLDEGERLAEPPAVIELVTLANSLTKTTPVTLNKVVVPTAPRLVRPLNDIVLVS